MHRASAAAACDWQSLTLARWPGEFQVGRRRPGPGPPTVSGATLTKFGRHATHSDRDSVSLRLVSLCWKTEYSVYNRAVKVTVTVAE